MTHAIEADIAARRRNALAIVIVAGIAGGLVDALYFSTIALLNGRSPAAVLQSIATFWPGMAAREGGAASAVVGLTTHFGLATIMAAGYYFLAKSFALFRRWPRASGTAYGLVLYGVMYFIVLPLRWPEVASRFEGARSLPDIAAHVGVGIAIALVVSPWLVHRQSEISR